MKAIVAITCAAGALTVAAPTALAVSSDTTAEQCGFYTRKNGGYYKHCTTGANAVNITARGVDSGVPFEFDTCVQPNEDKYLGLDVYHAYDNGKGC